MRLGAFLSGAVLVAIGGIGVWIGLVTRVIPISAVGYTGVALVIGGLAALVLSVRAPFWKAAVALGATAVVANWILVLGVMRPFEMYKPVKPMSDWINTFGDRMAPVVHYKTPLPSMTYYLGRPVVQEFDMPSMLQVMRDEGDLYALMRPEHYAELQKRTTTPMCVIQSRPLPVFDAKLSEILQDKLPQILLVGTKAACDTVVISPGR